MSRLSILFLSAWFPYPPNNGSKLRIYNLLRGLASRYQVDLVALADQPAVRSDIAELRALCCDVQIVSRKDYRPKSLRAILGFLSPIPRSIVDTFSPQMSHEIAAITRRKSFDVVIASELTMASYWPAYARLPAVFDDLEIGVFDSKIAQAPSPLHRLRHQLTQLKQRHYLNRLLPRFRACTVVSEQERVLVRRAAPGYGPIAVIPNCVNLSDYRSVQATRVGDRLIFTGSFRYFANHDAMIWFLERIYPRIQAQAPGVELTITGDHANLPLPAADNVTLTDFVDDVRPLIASSWVSLAPIRLGGGTRLKILEAMALRTPVVATSKGAEGLDVQHDEHLLIADTPQAFADAVVRLLQDSALRRRLTENAYQLVSEKYDWAVVMPRFLQLVEQVATGRVEGRG